MWFTANSLRKSSLKTTTYIEGNKDRKVTKYSIQCFETIGVSNVGSLHTII